MNTRAPGIIDAAQDIVALWKNGKITGLPRAERNAAIEEARTRLIAAVDEYNAPLPKHVGTIAGPAPTRHRPG